MPQFSERSKKRLNTCLLPLQALFNAVIKHYDCTIICGHRDEAEQTLAFSRGYSKVSWPNSKHNKISSLAVDVAPWHKDKPHIRWKDKKKHYHFVGYVLGVAITLGLDIRCGADWDSDLDLDDQTFNDLVHFEIRGE